MDLFHKIVLQEFHKAWLEGKAIDSDYMKKVVYEQYEKELWELKKKSLLEIVD